MTSETDTLLGAALRKADGRGNKKTGTAGTLDIRIQLEISETSETAGTGNETPCA
jgi:hypothetical protein